ncbi:MAG: hypothetical protein RI920_700 [Pseudomonadota bacterium]
MQATATPISPFGSRIRSLTAGLAMSALSMASVSALAAGYEKGPDPTVASLEASGPFVTASSKLPNASDYGNGTTVFYPTDRKSGSFGLVVLCPGFVSPASLYSGIAQRIASHGFVVAVVSTKSLVDQPKARGDQIIAVMKAVIAQNKVQAVAYAGQVDDSRVAIGGHSAGGSGTFYAAVSQPQLKALVGLMPGEPGTNFAPFAGIRIPTLLLTGSIDALANSWAHPYFAQLDPTLPAAHIDLAGIGHLSLWTTATQASQGKIAKYVTAWVKRFVDEDTRYTPFVKTAASDMSMANFHGDY